MQVYLFVSLYPAFSKPTLFSRQRTNIKGAVLVATPHIWMDRLSRPNHKQIQNWCLLLVIFKNCYRLDFVIRDVWLSGMLLLAAEQDIQ